MSVTRYPPDRSPKRATSKHRPLAQPVFEALKIPPAPFVERGEREAPGDSRQRRLCTNPVWFALGSTVTVNRLPSMRSENRYNVMSQFNC